MKFERINLMVLDSLGVGEMPDAAEWGDAGSNTLGHVLASRQVHIPNLRRLGIGNIPILSDASGNAHCVRMGRIRRPATGKWRA